MTDFSLTLNEDDTGYWPGETITGVAEWDVDRTVDALEIRLIWFTDGIGDRDTAVVDQLVCEQMPHGSQRFEFSLPRGPYSFSGKQISLTWAVELVILPSEETESSKFVLSSTGDEVDLTNTPYAPQ